jgi:Ca2+-binding EF-hand superfamily protein
MVPQASPARQAMKEHSSMRRITGVLTALVVVGFAADAAAQGRGRGNQPQIRFQAMDTNGDGIIQRSEWRGSARSFEVHDWNGDGVLSGVEVQIGARRPARGTQGQPRDLDSPWFEQRIDDWTIEHYRRLDRDNNGRLTPAEWIYDRETFRRIDHNNDNWISPAEFLGDQEVDDDAEDLFEYLDENNDGRISRAEWHGTRARFDALDRNRDGFLSRAEAMGTDAPTDLFDAIDVNRDRVITRNEWQWSTASFDVRDVNRDGRLSRDEFIGITPDRSSAYQAGYNRGVIEGRTAGREDRVRNQGWDLEGQRELERADSGYQASMGPRAEYQAGYREGFRRGYREGWDQR